MIQGLLKAGANPTPAAVIKALRAITLQRRRRSSP